MAQTRNERIDILESHSAQKNYIRNPSATRSGTLGTASSSASIGRSVAIADRIDGVASFTCDTSALNGFCEWLTETIKKPDDVGNCEASVHYKGDGTLKSLVVSNGTSTLASIPLGNVADWTQASINYPCGTSRTVRIVQTTAGTTPALGVGRVYYGPARNIGTVAQATLYAKGTWAGVTNCRWSQSSGSYANFPADTDCNNPTVIGQASAPGTRIPALTLPSLPPGNYQINVTGNMGVDGAGFAFLRLTDGTNFSNMCSVFSNAGQVSHGGCTFSLRYETAQSNVTIQLQGLDSSAGNLNVYNEDSNQSFEIAIYRFPTASEQVFRPDSVIDTTGMVFPTSAATCPAGTLLADGAAVSRTQFGRLFQRIGITHGQGDGSTTFNLPDYRGRFIRGVDGTANRDEDKATRSAMATGGNTGNNVGSVQAEATNAQLFSPGGGTVFTSVSGQGAQVFGSQYPFPSTASGGVGLPAAVWPADSGTGNETRPDNAYVNYCISIGDTVQAPLLIGSVTSNSSGIERVERVSVAESCTASPCTIASQSGSWVSSITRGSTGAYTVNIAAGTFSSAPSCSCQPTNGSLGCSAVITTASAIAFTTRRFSTEADLDSGFSILCQGPR